MTETNPRATTNTTPRRFRRTAIEVTIGVALGFIAGTVFGPQLIKVWYEPPSKDAFSCAGSVEKALGQFVIFQLVTAALGGLLLALILFFLRRVFSKRKPDASVSN